MAGALPERSERLVQFVGGGVGPPGEEGVDGRSDRPLGVRIGEGFGETEGRPDGESVDPVPVPVVRTPPFEAVGHRRLVGVDERRDPRPEALDRRPLVRREVGFLRGEPGSFAPADGGERLRQAVGRAVDVAGDDPI